MGALRLLVCVWVLAGACGWVFARGCLLWQAGGWMGGREGRGGMWEAGQEATEVPSPSAGLQGAGCTTCHIVPSWTPAAPCTVRTGAGTPFPKTALRHCFVAQPSCLLRSHSPPFCPNLRWKAAGSKWAQKPLEIPGTAACKPGTCGQQAGGLGVLQQLFPPCSHDTRPLPAAHPLQFPPTHSYPPTHTSTHPPNPTTHNPHTRTSRGGPRSGAWRGSRGSRR